MGELLYGLFAIVFCALWLAAHVLYGVGWVLYHFFAWVLPPVWRWLTSEGSKAANNVVVYYRDATFEPRLEAETKRTMRRMDADAEQAVALFEEAARRAEQRTKLTSGV